ncbi:L-serine dehydratase, alpha chain [Lachnospiraceae bacterium]|nr:L-serine ammonia-lyase, iron-sulfur-dependent, subunit alpha [Lachnospiraceae bacterium]GFI30313.1 L-serine dehydratase, alpha chain [Lachnospiraceae bacterium]
MSFHSLEEIVSAAEQQKKPFFRIVLEDDMSERMVSEEESFLAMQAMYSAMYSADESYDGGMKSASGLVGNDGQKMEEAVKAGKTISGSFMGEVMVRALKMGESNACMKRIVAAPTAGSCGVMPAVFLTYQNCFHASDEKMTEAMFTAAGIGTVIAERAFLAGATGGCQAEIGSASAMAAGGLAYLMGGGNQEIIHASAIALKSLLGLVCDPVAGLVEVPCVKRNVIGAVNAVSSADMAMAGIVSRIPPDEVISAMRAIGMALPCSLKETGEGGLAATPSAVEIAKKLISDF